MITYKLIQLGGKVAALTVEQRYYIEKLFSWYDQTSQTELPLKPIKQHFKEWQTIDDDMDYFVKVGFLERYDRRYRFLTKNMPVISSDDIQNHLITLVNSLTEFDESIVFSAIYNTYNRFNLSFFSKNTALNYTVPSISHGENYLFQDTSSSSSLGLGSHFNSDKENALSKRILEQTGDVNQKFFVDMSGAVITAKSEESSRKIKEPNLFLNVLRELDYFEGENDKLAETVLYRTYKKQEFETEVEKVCKRLDTYFLEIDLESNSVTNELIQFMLLEQYLSGLKHSKQVIRFIQ